MRAYAVVAVLAFVACDKKETADVTPAPSVDRAPSAAPSVAPSTPSVPSPDAEPVPNLVYCHIGLGMCAQYTGLTADEFQNAKSRCIGDAKFDTKPCSEEDLLGTCDKWNGGQAFPEKVKMVLTKSNGLPDVAYARAFCDTGVFTEAPPPAPPSAEPAPRDAGRIHPHHAP